ncbi:hypothetical protein TNCV_928821 [Trichonephila clavipes]|nr:hypothetical protein TNCV_928821 [Trichonephila clavipes]
MIDLHIKSRTSHISIPNWDNRIPRKGLVFDTFPLTSSESKNSLFFTFAQTRAPCRGQYVLACFYPNFEREHPGNGQGPLASFPLPPTSQDDLRLFRAPSCREGSIQLQTPIPFPGFEPRSYGTTVSVVNHYTGRTAKEGFSHTVRDIGNEDSD